MHTRYITPVRRYIGSTYEGMYECTCTTQVCILIKA